MLKSNELRMMTEEGLAMLGAPDLAYVRAIDVNGSKLFGIFGADGTRMAVAETYDVAWALILQNDMEPVRVH